MARAMIMPHAALAPPSTSSQNCDDPAAVIASLSGSNSTVASGNPKHHSLRAMVALQLGELEPSTSPQVGRADASYSQLVSSVHVYIHTQQLYILMSFSFASYWLECTSYVTYVRNYKDRLIFIFTSKRLLYFRS